MKRDALQEMVEYVTSEKNVITEAVYPEAVHMVSNGVIVLDLRVDV